MLQALHYYAGVEGPHQQAAEMVYMELRVAILRNVVGVHQQSGFPWENYNDVDGGGAGSHPFTGWTALVVLVAAELYG